MGVGVEGEPCGVVPEDVTEGFHIDSALQGQRGECVPEIMEPDLVNPGSLEQGFHLSCHCRRVEVGAALGRWEQQRVVRVAFVFFEEQVDRLLGQHDFSHGVLGFRRQNLQLTVDSDDLFAHGDGAFVSVNVRPQQGQQLSPT